MTYDLFIYSEDDICVTPTTVLFGYECEECIPDPVTARAFDANIVPDTTLVMEMKMGSLLR